MQQEKIEFPKFTVPGQTNWVKWALVGVGGLVVVSGSLFAVALAKRDAPTAAVVAPAKAPEVPLAPSATPRPAQKPAQALAAASTTPADTATTADDASAPAKAASHRPRKTTHARTRSLAKASSSSPAGKAGNSGKPDAIDELLKKFK
jgi:hypothetical protein